MLVRERQLKTLPVVRGGYTLMEMLVVVAIIVVLAGIGGYYLLPRLDEAKENADLAQTKMLTSACETYKLNNGDYPGNLQALAERQPSGGVPIISPETLTPKLGSGLQYKYDPAGPNNQGMKPDIWVDGPNVKIGNWMTKPQH